MQIRPQWDSTSHTRGQLWSDRRTKKRWRGCEETAAVTHAGGGENGAATL